MCGFVQVMFLLLFVTDYVQPPVVSFKPSTDCDCFLADVAVELLGNACILLTLYE